MPKTKTKLTGFYRSISGDPYGNGGLWQLSGHSAAINDNGTYTVDIGMQDENGKPYIHEIVMEIAE